MLRQFDVVIERDEEGFYVASVPQIPACHTQARSLDEITQRIREAIELCLDVEGVPERKPQKARGGKVKDAATVALEKTVTAALGLAVNIDHRDPGGTVHIRYRDLDQLDFADPAAILPAQSDLLGGARRTAAE